MKNVILLLTLFIVIFNSCKEAAVVRPNVIIIMTDDQGYGDIAAHGNPDIRTPNMDQLHNESVRLTDFHVDPTCAPTRSALMTGKYSHNVRVWHTVRGGNHMRASEVTMADVFKQNGYQTGMFGKWHLGANYPYRPMDRGFEEWLGLGDGGTGTSDCWFWNDRVNDVYWHNGEREYREGFNPDVFFEAAMDYIRDRSGDKPFFIYLPTYVPHKPHTFPDPAFADYYIDQGMDEEKAAFYAQIEHIDWNIARLRKTLADEGINDNTILIFLTDNGSTQGRHSFNAGMSGGKGGTVDGGHRVPCFIHWPAGNIGEPRNISRLTAHIDLLPTLVDLCSMELEEEIDFDGKSIASLLLEDIEDWPDRTLFVEKQRSLERNPENSAIMTQQWRLVGHKKLYDIQMDPAQQNDIAAMHPEIVNKLLKDFELYWAKVTVDDRSFPTPIVGTPYDEEILLSISELRDGEGYAHGYAAEGREAKGVWHIEVAEDGTYEFEVCRWPKEAHAMMRAVPKNNKTVDAWSTRGPITGLLTKGKMRALDIGTVSIKVGDYFETTTVTDADSSLIFEIELPASETTVDAIFYDSEGQRISNAYYVYVRKKSEV